MCSGSSLFGFPLGAGLTADEVAAFAAGLRPRDYIDLDTAGLATLPLRAARDFTGVLRGEAVEATYRRLLGDRRLGELAVPVYAPVWDVDHDRVVHLGPERWSSRCPTPTCGASASTGGTSTTASGRPSRRPASAGRRALAALAADLRRRAPAGAAGGRRSGRRAG